MKGYSKKSTMLKVMNLKKRIFFGCHDVMTAMIFMIRMWTMLMMVLMMMMMMMNVKTSCDSVGKGRPAACAPVCNKMTMMIRNDDNEDRCKNKIS